MSCFGSSFFYFEYSFTGIFRSWYIMEEGRKNSMGENITTTLNALAEPTRLQIVELLRKGPLTVGEIAENLQLLQPATSKHLRVLHQAKLVEVDAVANRRIYKLSQQPFRDLESWIDSFKQVWEQRFDRLDEYLRNLQEKK
jgi:DNA-binding transcriptional ArsR family regulator